MKGWGQRRNANSNNLTDTRELCKSRNILQQDIRRLKKNRILSKTEEIQEYASKHDSRKFYQAIKELHGPIQKKECPVKDTNGSWLKGREEIQSR